MAKKKKQIYCRCGCPANWYKKGKNHRVLVCGQCGVIANNPVPLALGAIALGKKFLPDIVEGAKSFLSKKEKSPTTDAPSIHRYDSLDKPNYSERVVNKVLHDERLD